MTIHHRVTHPACRFALGNMRATHLPPPPARPCAAAKRSTHRRFLNASTATKASMHGFALHESVQSVI